MRECFKPYYFEDNEIKGCDQFTLDFITEGTTLYEVVRIINGKSLFLKDHINRLFTSAKLSGFVLWKDFEEIKGAIFRIIDKNKSNTGNIKFLFNFRNGKRKFVAYFIEHHYPTPEQYSNGVSVVSTDAVRPNPNAKVYNFNLRKETDRLIQNHQVYEVILINEEGYITEGSKSNLFCIKSDDVYTAPENLVLPGITRKYVVQVCNKLDLNVIERKMTLSELKGMDAIFLTGTSPKVLPVSKINDQQYEYENIHLKHIMTEYDMLIKTEIEKA